MFEKKYCDRTRSSLFGACGMFALVSVLFLAVVLMFAGCASRALENASDDLEDVAQVQRSQAFHDKYSLEKVIVLSRHNIRSPLSDPGSILGKVTTHEWFEWTSAPSELSLRGGVLETIMGQYFRKWLISERLISENHQPKDGEMRFYANSMQRTIATAQYFSSGMLPVANVRIEHAYAPSKMDDVFNPQLTFISEDFEKTALKQIDSLAGNGGLAGIGGRLLPAYKVLERTLDFDKSLYAKEFSEHFKTDDTKVILALYKEPSMAGSLKIATAASDALVLQYYEEPDSLKAAFGHELSMKDWEDIASIKDVYTDVLFTAPAVARNAARPLLSLMMSEILDPVRKFTFLCGHDSNIASVLAALGVQAYSLPGAIEKKTPIGSKLVIEVWKSASGGKYVSFMLVYQTVQQLRDCSLLTLDNPPAKYVVRLSDMPRNSDGLYRLEDVLGRFSQAVSDAEVQ